MSDRNTYREDVRPTLPSVRDLFRDELSRSPRPPVNLSPPWIVPSPRTDASHYRSFPRAESHEDTQLYGPGVQRSSSSTGYGPLPPQQRYDIRATSHSFPPDNLSSSTSQYHSYPHPQYHARSTSQADQQAASHDHSTSSGSYTYSASGTQSYTRSYTSAGISSRGSYHDATGPYSEGYQSDQQREPIVGPVASEVARQPPSSPPSTSKYECDYCGKGFTRPSSLKIHLNSHTGEKPFVCTFVGCGRSFSVLSNMRRHARVHTEISSRQQESSSDEHSDKQ